MKKQLLLPLIALFALAGCSSSGEQSSSSTSESESTSEESSSSSQEEVVPATTFASTKAYFDTSLETIPNIGVTVGEGSSCTALVAGRRSAEEGQYTLKDGVLAISGEFLKQLTANEYTLRATIDGKTVSIDMFAATKVITTAEEFVAINEDSSSLQGYYILGNDIDLSGISNFEPIGRYYTETDPNNAYFHGILDGNGHTIKGAKVYWSDTVASNYNVYAGSGTSFTDDAHKAGDNIGLFQFIGSSGVVRNTVFSDIHVRGRTIVGVIAGNNLGLVENCIVDASCSVEMGTHFYDNDCNMGGAFGIVGGSGRVNNVICQNTSQTLGALTATTIGGVTIEQAGIYVDFDDDYASETGNGWDHGPNEPNGNVWWKFCGVDLDSISADSNGAPSNGQYAFVGKCWGTVSNCVAQSFKITPMNGSPRDIYFGQTHLGANKPTSGETDLGTFTNNQMCTLAEIKSASTYSDSSWDTTVWNIVDGSVPTLIDQYPTVA